MQAVYDEFVEKVKAKVATLTVGPSEDPANYMGPVISAGAQKTILDYIETGKKEGRLIAGGAAAQGDGYFIQPTVIADVDSKARIFQEEIFGPVLAVTKARDFDHALELANDTEYGLTGAAYIEKSGKDPQGARGVFRRQSVHQSQMHGRDGRRASLWRIQYVGHRFKGRRAGLSAAIPAAEIDRRKDLAAIVRRFTPMHAD